MIRSHIQKIVQAEPASGPKSQASSSRLSSGEKKSRIFKYRQSPFPSQSGIQSQYSRSQAEASTQRGKNQVNIYDARSIKSDQFRNSKTSVNDGNSRLSFVATLREPNPMVPVRNANLPYQAYNESRIGVEMGVESRGAVRSTVGPVTFNYRSPSPGHHPNPRVEVKNNFTRTTVISPQPHATPQPHNSQHFSLPVSPPNAYLNRQITPPKIIYSSAFSPFPTGASNSPPSYMPAHNRPQPLAQLPPLTPVNAVSPASHLVKEEPKYRVIKSEIYSPRVSTQSSASIPNLNYLPVYTAIQPVGSSSYPSQPEPLPSPVFYDNRRESQFQNTAINMLEPLRADLTQYMNTTAAKQSFVHTQPDSLLSEGLHRDLRMRTSQTSRTSNPAEMKNSGMQRYPDLQVMEQNMDYRRPATEAQPPRRSTEVASPAPIPSLSPSNFNSGPPANRYFDKSIRMPLRKLDTLGAVVEEITVKKKEPEPRYVPWVVPTDNRMGFKDTPKLKESVKPPSFDTSLDSPCPTFKKLSTERLRDSFSPPMLPCQNEVEEQISQLNISEIKQAKELNQSNSCIQVPSPTLSHYKPLYPSSLAESPRFESSTPTPSPVLSAPAPETLYAGWTLQNLIIVVVLIGIGLLMIFLQLWRD